MFPISEQWEEEGAPSQVLHRNGNPLVQFDFIQVPHQILPESVQGNAAWSCENCTVTYFLSFYWGFVHSEKDWNLFDLLPGGNTP